MRKVRNKEATERKEKENRTERRRRENPCSCTDKAAMLFSCSSLDSQTALLSWSHTAMNAPSTLLREAEETCECERESEKHEHICVFLCKKRSICEQRRAQVCVCVSARRDLPQRRISELNWKSEILDFLFERLSI